MAYRNGTYVAFAADGNRNITTSDIRFYNLIKGWNSMKSKEFQIINSHEKGSSIRSGSMDETIKRTLRERLDNSTRMLLLVGNTTRFDNDFVPYEISYAIDKCKIPIIVCYVNESQRIINNTFSDSHRRLLPKVLMDRINAGETKTIHIPFKESIIMEAIDDYNHSRYPVYPISLYTADVYDRLQIK